MAKRVRDPKRSVVKRDVAGLSSSALKPRSDLTYKTLDGLRVQKLDLHQSLFTGSLVRHSQWSGVKFRRSDLDGVRMEHCTFERCDFDICDIRSSHFVACHFVSCSLEDAFIDDCEFSQCRFSKCSFSGSSVARSRFLDSELNRCSMSPGTFLHNRLYRCTIADTALGDCTVLYVIFRDCKLTRIKLNAESAGAILGLTRQQVQDIDFIYLGKGQPTPKEVDIVGLLSEEYERRAWYVGSLVNQLNFETVSAIAAFDSYLARTQARFLSMGFAKGDEIQFLGDILEELADRASLPLSSALAVLKWCGELEPQLSRTHSEQGPDAGLRTLIGRTTLLVQGMLETLERGLPAGLPADGKIELKAVFEQAPDLPLHAVMSDLVGIPAFGRTDATLLLREESGSYVEVVMTTLFSLTALQVFLFLINGCVIQITELKYRLGVLRRQDAPKAYSELALAPVQQTSPVVLSMLQALTQYVKGLSWLKEPKLGGFSAQNVKALEILSVPSGADQAQV